MSELAPSSAPRTQEPRGFARRLGLFDAVMIVVSGIIGSGIFVNPYLVAQWVKTPSLVLGVWVAGGAIALAGAFVFAELATVVPKVGGSYAFFRAAFHPAVAFLQGWAILWIVQTGATAAVAVAFAEYLVRLAGWPRGLVPWLGASVLAALAAFHALGIRPGAVLINVVTFLKTLVLAVVVIGAIVFVDPAPLAWTPIAPPSLAGWPLLSAFFAALIPTMFTFGGWQNVNFVAEEVRDPERVLPRAIRYGVFVVIAVYLATNYAYLRVLGAEGLAATRTPAADLATHLAGDFGGRAIGVLVVISTFGFLNLALLSAPRVYYAMAADGLFFRRLATLSPRFRAPTAAILLQGGLAALLALAGAYERLVGFAAFADWIGFALSGIALFVLRKKRPDAARPFPTPGYPWLPALFVFAGVGIVANQFVADLQNALAASAVLALGVPAYLYWARQKRNEGVGEESGFSKDC